jgi:hypothetical protein
LNALRLCESLNQLCVVFLVMELLGLRSAVHDRDLVTHPYGNHV